MPSRRDLSSSLQKRSFVCPLPCSLLHPRLTPCIDTVYYLKLAQVSSLDSAPTSCLCRGSRTDVEKWLKEREITLPKRILEYFVDSFSRQGSCTFSAHSTFYVLVRLTLRAITIYHYKFVHVLSLHFPSHDELVTLKLIATALCTRPPLTLARLQARYSPLCPSVLHAHQGIPKLRARRPTRLAARSCRHLGGRVRDPSRVLGRR